MIVTDSEPDPVHLHCFENYTIHERHNNQFHLLRLPPHKSFSVSARLSTAYFSGSSPYPFAIPHPPTRRFPNGSQQRIANCHLFLYFPKESTCFESRNSTLRSS